MQTPHVLSSMTLRRRPPGGHWFWLENAVVESWGRILGAYPLTVYMVLVCKSRDGVVIGCSAEEIAVLLRISRATVFRSLALLQAFGLIVRAGKAGSTNIFHVPELPPSGTRLATPPGGMATQPLPPRSDQASLTESRSVADRAEPRRTEIPPSSYKTQDCKTVKADASASAISEKAQELWALVLMHLKSVMGASTYDCTFRDTWGVDIRHGVLYVEYRDSLDRDLAVMYRFGRDVKNRLKQLGYDLRAQYVREGR